MGIIVKIERIDAFGRKVTQETNREWWIMRSEPWMVDPRDQNRGWWIHVIRTVDGGYATGCRDGNWIQTIRNYDDRTIGSQEI